jgi:hypothetical protein
MTAMDKYMMRFVFVFRPDMLRRDCTGRLYLRVTEYGTGETAFATTRYDLRYDEWDPVGGCFILPGEEDSERARLLLDYVESMAADVRRIDAIVREMETDGCRTPGDVVRRWRQTPDCNHTPARSFWPEMEYTPAGILRSIE